MQDSAVVTVRPCSFKSIATASSNVTFGSSDKEHSELDAERIYDIFKQTYRNIASSFHISECHFRQHDGIEATITITSNDGTNDTVTANGNGRLDAVSIAIKKHFNITYELTEYTEHALSRGSSSKALAYVGITAHHKLIWGVGMDEDIIKASIHALTAAINRAGLSTLDRSLAAKPNA